MRKTTEYYERGNNMTAMVMGMKELIAKAKQEKKKKDK